ncbi:MAG: NUDIX domain-containing protein [Acetobacter sp.]|nr:NUDIX domain-containing protein [Bacteroides sp.]MCM1341252.1 NUDIX domain-containing protein [Acetobacter sp.]MCM1433895.1 NUDIX domain-containing protein [Clostridiales bacterium]
MEDYIKKVRKKIGHEELILNYAGCIIFDEQGRLLLQKRSDCNQWGILGGMVEYGESVAEAAIREIKEESGLDVKITSLFGVYSKYYAEYTNGDKAQPIVHLFKAEIIGGELIERNNETLELKFFDLNDVPSLFCKQHQDMLDDIIAGREYVYR